MSGTPTWRATSCAALRSAARLGETPSTAITLSAPSACVASASKRDESTPPESNSQPSDSLEAGRDGRYAAFYCPSSRVLSGIISEIVMVDSPFSYPVQSTLM